MNKMDMKILPGEEDIKCLYKYRGLIDYNDCNRDPSSSDGYKIRENTLNMLKYGEIYFSKPREFNDPFDCFVDEIVDGTEDEFEHYLKCKGKTNEYIQEIIRQKIAGELNFDDLLKDDKSQDFFKVFCLAKNFDNILMWSHYADNHKGICIGFRIGVWHESLALKCKPGFLKQFPQQFPDGNDFFPLFHVKYDDNRPDPYNLIRKNKDIIKDFIYNKGKCWAYEDEYRIVLNDEILLGNPAQVEDNEIEEIIFGLRTPSNIKAKIIGIIKSCRNSNAKIYEIKKMNKLDRVQIK
jgi:hypothetical protein